VGSNPTGTIAARKVVMTITTFISILSAVVPGRWGTDTRPTGADAVRQAHAEDRSITEQTFDATLGEPDIEVPDNHDFVRQPKIYVPVVEVPYGDGGAMAFDLSTEGEEETEFEKLMDVAGVSLENVEDIEGLVVPIRYVNGNPTVDWLELWLTGDRDDPWTETDFVPLDE